MDEKTGYTTADLVGFGFLGFAALIAALYVAFGWPAIGNFLVNPATAAWVQAVGALGAIAAVAWQLWLEKKAAVQRRKDAHVELMLGAVLAGRDSYSVLEFIARRMQQEIGHPLPLRTELIEELQATCRAVTSQRDLHPATLTVMMNVQRILARTLMDLRATHMGQPITNAQADAARDRANGVRMITWKMHTHYTKIGGTGMSPTFTPSDFHVEYPEMEV